MRLTGHVRLTRSKKEEAKEKRKRQTPNEWGLNMGKKGGESGKEEMASALVSSGPHTAYTCLVYVVGCFPHEPSHVSRTQRVLAAGG